MSTSEPSEDKQETAAENKQTDSSGPAEKTSGVKGNESHGQNNRVFESDEDIPGDFFDDFLKEDFMAGLDIVDDDEWDEDKVRKDKESSEKSKKDSKPQTDTVNKKKRQKVASKTSNGDKKSVDEKERSKQRKKRRDEKSDDSKQKKNSDKPIDADEFDIRRDPEKTKRDIARDKVRCEKDKEMKIISEKLSFVETGLVPPGMEMEIDIEEIKKQKEKFENNSPRDLREHLKDLKGKNKSPNRKVKSPKRRSLPRRSPNVPRKVSPIRRRSRSRSPRRELLPLSRIVVSPIRRSPRRSPFRLPSPRRLSPIRLRSPLRRFVRRRSRSPSPLYRNRRGKFSPIRRRERSLSRESDREKWLKHRNRSRSPRRKREDAKKSFLQEIAEKLNEIRQPMNMMPQLQQMQPMQPMQPILQPMQPTLRYVEPQPMPVPAPTPVPAPAAVPVFPNPQQPQFDPYDQNFFIGTPQPAALTNFPVQSQPSPQMQLNVQPINSPLVLPNNIVPNPRKVGLTLVNPNQLRQIPESQEDITKLFQDKQISLSEFLAITAKPEVFSSSPTHLQEKIKVITRCHDAIKILEASEKKYSGRLVVHKTDKYKVKTGKNLSPLKCAPLVQFPFTDPAPPPEEDKSSFMKFVNDLLGKLGLLPEPVVIVDDEKSPVAPPLPKMGNIEYSPPPPPFISPIKKPNKKPVKNPNKNNINVIRQGFMQTNQLSKMVQTEVFKCVDCEKRKKTLYRAAGMQTNESCATFSVSTQVTEEDFQLKIPKTQSLAALTPAQLLAKSRESLSAATRGNRMDADNFDAHQTGYNRPNFFRGADNFRPAPFANPMSVYDSMEPQMYEGGGRGREVYSPRTLDPNVRFSHNNYY